MLCKTRLRREYAGFDMQGTWFVDCHPTQHSTCRNPHHRPLPPPPPSSSRGCGAQVSFLRSRLALFPLLPWRGVSKKPSGKSFQLCVAGRVLVCVLIAPLPPPPAALTRFRRSAACSSLESSYDSSSSSASEM